MSDGGFKIQWTNSRGARVITRGHDEEHARQLHAEALALDAADGAEIAVVREGSRLVAYTNARHVVWDSPSDPQVSEIQQRATEKETTIETIAIAAPGGRLIAAPYEPA